MKFETDQFYLKSAEEMEQLFPEYPEMMLNTCRIAEQCNCVIPQPGPLLPVYQIPEGFDTKEDYIRHLVEEGLKNATTPLPKRLPRELTMNLVSL